MGADFVTIPIDRDALVHAINMCSGVVKYKLGAKPPINSEPGTFKLSDCSGFMRWVLHYATRGATETPDGSWNQDQWCQNKKFKKVVYSEVAMLKDSRLRIAFMKAEDGDIGHVWLIFNGETIECYGRTGVGRRAWNTKKLKTCVDTCYVLTDKLLQ